MMDDPLEGIDAIHGDELRHAYGSAEDVPERLRGFIAPEDDGDDAQDLVMGSLWHQGSVYPATAVAVPFLARLLRTPKVWCRSALATGLVLIATAARRTNDNDILAALAASADDLRAAGTNYVDLADAMDRVLAITESASPDLLNVDELLEGLEDLQIDPPAVPVSAPTVPSPAAMVDPMEFAKLVAGWDPLHGAEPDRWRWRMELEARCREPQPTQELADRANAIADLFVGLHLGIADAVRTHVKETRLRGPVGGLRLGGVTVSTCLCETVVDWRYPSSEFTLIETLGPQRVLCARLDGAQPEPGFALRKEEGRYVLACSAPMDPDACTFEAFLLLVSGLHAERDRLLGP
jgi:hypothetical protein